MMVGTRMENLDLSAYTMAFKGLGMCVITQGAEMKKGPKTVRGQREEEELAKEREKKWAQSQFTSSLAFLFLLKLPGYNGQTSILASVSKKRGGALLNGHRLSQKKKKSQHLWEGQAALRLSEGGLFGLLLLE